MIVLKDLPELSHWFQTYQKQPLLTDDSLTKCVIDYCLLLDDCQRYSPDKYLQPMLNYLSQGQAVLDDLYDLYQFMNEKGFDIEGFIIEIAEEASVDHHQPFYKHLSQLASLTKYGPLQFLAGWYALNIGMNLECIHECGKIKEPSPQVFTLKGQAELEIGLIDQAIASLKISLQKSSTDALTWYQLAKVYHVSGQQLMAWDALIKCHELMPDSTEIPPFMAIIAMAHEPLIPAQLHQAWNVLTQPHFNRSSLEYIECLFDLSFAAGKEGWIQWICDHCNLNVFLEPRGLKQLPSILNKFHSRSWHRGSQQFLTALDLPEGVDA